MAGAWDAKVEISTADATLNLRNLKTEAAGLAAALRALDTELVAGQRNIQAIAKSFTEMVVAQRAAAAAQKDLAAASIAQAKADGVTITNNAKIAESAAKVATEEQRKYELEQLGIAKVATEDLKATGQAEANQVKRDQLAAREIANQEKKAVAAQAAAAKQVKTDRSNNSDLTLSDNLSNSRYLLYDVGATYGVLSAALLAIPAATAAVSAAYQADFAQVLRVTHQTADEASGLRQNLKDLATQIPLSFSDLTNITQIGAQMGIANDKLTAFTETVAKFTVVTGIGTQTAATLFGRLQNMFPDEAKSTAFFNNIGSAIAKVGADTVATDPQIASMGVQIAAVGASAGFTAAQTIGLSAALASVAVQPELARSSLTRLFGKLNLDVADGSSKMTSFAGVLKMTSQQATSLWQSDPSAFFQQLISGLHDVQVAQGGVGLTSTLQSLGITSVRDVSVLTRLAVGYDTLATSLTSATEASRKGTALDEMSKPVFSTLGSQLKEIGAAIKNLMDTLGSGSLGPMTQFLDLIKSFITGFDHMIQTVPGFKVFLGIAAVLAIVSGAFLALKTAQAFALAGLVGFQQVAGKAGLSGALSLTGILQQLAKTWLMAGGANADAAATMVASSGTMRSAALAASGGAKELNATFAATGTTAGVAANGANLLKNALTALSGVGILAAISALTSLVFGMQAAAQESDDMGKAIAEGLKTGAADGISAITKAISELKVDPSKDGLYGVVNWGKSFSDVAKEAGVSMTDIVSAISHGKPGIDEFQKSLDKVAKSKGFANFDDWSNSAQKGGVAAQSLANHVNDLINKSVSAADDSKVLAAAAKAVGGAADGSTPQVDQFGNAIDTTATKADAATKAMKDYLDSVFSLTDAAMATSDSLEKLGGSLQKSTSFDMGDAAGRDNLKNYEDTLRNAALEQQNLINSGQETATQAANNYNQFISGLMQKLSSMGVDTSQIRALADQAASAFDDQITKAPKAVLTPAVNMAPAAAQAQADTVDTLTGINNFMRSNPTVGFEITTNPDSLTGTAKQVYDLAKYISAQTGIPFKAVIDAFTQPASLKSKDVSDYMTKLMGMQYTAGLTADASAAYATVNAFKSYANSVMGTVNNSYGVLAPKASNFAGVSTGTFSSPLKQATATADAPKAPSLWSDQSSVADASTSASDNALSSLGALTNGYNNAAAAASKAGSAGQKAGKDAANGINDATAAVNDYASRLQTSLTSAYDKQYGMQIATDNYQKALNAIVDKRAADLKSIQDLIDKQKELNDGMNTDLVDANKAKTEQAISIKYGEGARAADYGAKAQTALDNAAAKKKEMDADAAQQKTLQDGIGDLTSNTNAAIANREAVRNLETQMLAMVDAYAKTGASQQQVADYAASLSAKFQDQVTQAGFNSGAVRNLTGDMGRYRDAVKAVPTTVNTNLGTSSNGSPGVGGYINDVNNAKNAANNVPRDVWTAYHFIGDYLTEMPGNQASNYQPIYQKFDSAGHNTGAKYFNEGGQVEGFADGGQIPGTPPANPRVDNLMAQVDGKGMIRVRSKEFIQPQEAVDYYGLDFMNQIRKMQLPRFNYGGQVGGSGGGRGPSAGVQVVELTAANIAAIARIADQQINLYTNDEIIAQSAGRGNVTLASKGWN